MILIDDLILRGLGLSLKPFDMIWIMELMRDYALKEKYNIKEIHNKLKENRLLFEIGEINGEEYKKMDKMLLEELETAKEVIEKLSSMNIAELH